MTSQLASIAVYLFLKHTYKKVTGNSVNSWLKRCKQVPDLVVDQFRIGHRAGDLVAQQLAVPAANTVHGDLHSSFGQFQIRRQAGIRRGALWAAKHHLEPLE